MLKIRLQRVGKKHDPSFRIVLVDSRRGPKSGNFLEILGSYNAQKGDPQFKNSDRIKELTSKGAQISPTVSNLLVKAGILKRDIIDVSAKSKKKAEEAAPAEGEAAPAEPKIEEKPTEEAPATPEEKPAEPAKEEEKPKAEEKKESKPEEPKEEAKTEESA